MATLCRTNNGLMVHRSDCQIVHRPKARPVPWEWADTVPADHVQRAVAHLGYRACFFCKPLPDGRDARYREAIRRKANR